MKNNSYYCHKSRGLFEFFHIKESERFKIACKKKKFTKYHDIYYKSDRDSSTYIYLCNILYIETRDFFSQFWKIIIILDDTIYCFYQMCPYIEYTKINVIHQPCRYDDYWRRHKRSRTNFFYSLEKLDRIYIDLVTDRVFHTSKRSHHLHFEYKTQTAGVIHTFTRSSYKRGSIGESTPLGILYLVYFWLNRTDL